MFGPRLTTVFASRWRAVWFAASTLLLAYCSLPDANDNGSAQTSAVSQHHANPWALDKSK